MIRYKITLADLQTKVDAVQPNWRSRADKRTERFRRAGTYQEPPAPFWSEIKSVFMRLQHNKCAYCERQMAALEHGKIEHDIEHFRGKNSVAAWPPDGSKYTYLFATGGDFANGYYLLAYNLKNYAVACKPCNSILKSNYFPIAGTRIPDKDDPDNLVAEKPLLIFPIGENAVDPCKLIRFDGPVPIPVATDPNHYDYQRTQVTIDLFELATREELLRERLTNIVGLCIALEREQNGSQFHGRYAKYLTGPKSPHSSCLKCFAQLFSKDPAKAKAIAAQALTYLESVHDQHLQRQ